MQAANREELIAALSGVKLPALSVIEAELQKRAAVWHPQHAESCHFYKQKPSENEWRANECRCPQAMAYFSEADITGYGGAAGGGKSDLVDGLGLTRHRRSIVFRRESKEVRDLFRRAVEICSTAGAEYKSKASTGDESVYLPNGDREIEYAGVKNPGDWEKYRGRAKDGYFFDEAHRFDEATVRSLIGWNRSTLVGQRCRTVLTFNPPSAKHGQWLVVFFAPWLDPKHQNPAEYGELRWFTTIRGRDVECANGDPVELDGDNIKPQCEPRQTVDRDGVERCAACGAEVLLPLSRTFIKALLNDNLYLKNTKYRATLMGLPEPLRSQLLYGDFNADEPDDAYQLIKLQWVLDAQERWSEAMAQDHTPLEQPLSALANDPAHGGADDNVNAARIGAFVCELEAIPGVEVPRGKHVIARLALYASRFINTAGRALPVGMDVIGVGSAPQEVAEDAGLRIIAFDGSSREGLEQERDRKTGLLGFKNHRALWWWRFREALDPDSPSYDAPMLPPDRELLADLCAVHFEVTPSGIQIESKDDIRKTLGRSPGKGDATVYVWNTKGYDFSYETVESRRNLDDIASTNDSWKTNGFR